MANASTTGFGFRPIKKVGQTDNVGALTEYSVAASSALISHAAMVQLTAGWSCTRFRKHRYKQSGYTERRFLH